MRPIHARHSDRGSAGIAIYELLVVAANLLMLASVFFAVAAPSRKAARGADAIGRLRQLGSAGAVYLDQTGVLPVGCLSLAEASGLGPNFCLVPDDKAVAGAGQECAIANRRPAPRRGPRYSFYGIADAGWREAQWRQAVEAGRGAGWLVDPTPGTPAGNGPCMYEGAYRRLLVEGSVLTRQHIWHQSSVWRSYKIEQWFAELPPVWHANLP